MSKIAQFFSEFYNMPREYIEKLDKNIEEKDLYEISDSDIRDIITGFDTSKYNIELCKEQMKKLDEINAKNDIDYITYLDEEYPNRLKNIDYCPKVLYYKGDISLLKKEKT
ncbi:hypothetical protein HMPREF0379_1861 [[Eubacterium] yurii subsp. margaretiae ATCC 43715]|nr:hypothetical protein HMPREF0379_1861 [[Eubacterium] yurii subsp. margaretiae ATCC 43715]